MSTDTCLILSHGAGSNRNAPLLVRVASAFESDGIAVDRIDLAFRQKKPAGSPFPGSAAADRESIADAVNAARGRGCRRVYIGGHSYGGRQSSMLIAERPGIADGLLLFAYPLKPPRSKGPTTRTAHFPDINVPVLLFHGTRDPFGTPEELAEAIRLIPGETKLITSERDGHDLAKLGADLVAREFRAFFMK